MMKKTERIRRILTKKEACFLLKIKIKDLEFFESATKISARKEGYTEKEFSRLRRSVADFYGVVKEREGIGR